MSSLKNPRLTDEELSAILAQHEAQRGFGNERKPLPFSKLESQHLGLLVETKTLPPVIAEGILRKIHNITAPQ